ncbi:glycosyltransferase family 39 protein [Planctomycetota bacterium]
MTEHPASRSLATYRTFGIWVLGIVLIAAGLRFYRLDYESLWMDEIRQVCHYSVSLKEVIVGAAGQQQPPLDYLIGWGMHRIGLADTDWWVRVPAASFGVGSVILLIAWACQVVGRPGALAAGLLLSVSPLFVRMSQEARPYTIFVFFALLSLFLFVRARVQNRKRDWCLFGGAFGLLLITRWVGPLVLTAILGVYCLVPMVLTRLRASPDEARQERFRFLASVAIFLSAFCVYSPLLWRIIRNSRHYINLDTQREYPGLVARAGDMLRDAFVAGFPVGSWFVLLCVASGLFLLLRAVGRDSLETESPDCSGMTRRPHLTARRVFMAVLGAFPLAYTAIFVLLSRAPHLSHYLLLMVPFTCVCVGALIQKLWTVQRRRWLLRTIAVSLLVTIAAPAAVRSWERTQVRGKRDWRTACRIAADHGDTDTALFVSIAQGVYWSPPFYGVLRYLANRPESLSIRQLAAKVGDGPLHAGALYAGLYFGCHSPLCTCDHSPPLSTNELPEGMERYDCHKLTLFRYPGTPDSVLRRLLALLQAIEPVCRAQGHQHVHFYHALSRLHMLLGNDERAERAYQEAISQCAGDDQRQWFIKYAAPMRMGVGERRRTR